MAGTVPVGQERVGIPWVCILAFLRVTTDPRARVQPARIDESVAVVNSWLERTHVIAVSPGTRHWSILSELLPSAQARGPLATDAHIAALAIEHGAVLATNDCDFARFQDLKLIYPLPR